MEDNVDLKEIKLCRDCKYERRDFMSYIPILGAKFRTFSKCGHPKFTEFDTVTGDQTADIYCTVLRQYKCGIEAKYFEPK